MFRGAKNATLRPKWEEYALEFWRVSQNYAKLKQRQELIVFIRVSFLDPFLERYPEMAEVECNVQFRRLYYDLILRTPRPVFN